MDVHRKLGRPTQYTMITLKATSHHHEPHNNQPKASYFSFVTLWLGCKCIQTKYKTILLGLMQILPLFEKTYNTFNGAEHIMQCNHKN